MMRKTISAILLSAVLLSSCGLSESEATEQYKGKTVERIEREVFGGVIIHFTDGTAVKFRSDEHIYMHKLD